MTTNKQQLAVIWIAAIYFAVLGSSFLLRSYYHQYHHDPYVRALADVAERNLKKHSASKDYVDPAVAKLEEVSDKIDRESVEKYEQSLWFKLRATIFRAPDVLMLGLPFIICLGAVVLYSLKSNRKKN